ncbi:MAG: hypothetical protein K9J25_13695 [Bacteroidales bacterium]|nr:hypothetical protein [Bacteroidales bacterium]
MKDLVIKGKWIKRELIVLLVLLLVSVITNAVGIIKHDTEWIEMLSQLHVVVLLTMVLYVLTAIIRILIYLIIMPFRAKK